MKVQQIVLGVILLIGSTACSKLPSLTQTNLDKIQNGMSSAEVQSILGKPTESQSEQIPIVGGTKTTYIYSSQNNRATVILKNDTVQSKEGHFNNQ